MDISEVRFIKLQCTYDWNIGVTGFVQKTLTVLNWKNFNFKCNNYTPPLRTTKLLGGILVSLNLSVRSSVRPSRMPCPLCNIYSSGWILSILGTNDHYHKRVCCAQWPLTLTYIFKVIRPDLENSARSVASTVLDGFFLYMAQMITIIRGCVASYVFFRIKKFEFLVNFLNFSALTLKKNLHFLMDSFHI